MKHTETMVQDDRPHRFLEGRNYPDRIDIGQTKPGDYITLQTAGATVYVTLIRRHHTERDVVRGVLVQTTSRMDRLSGMPPHAIDIQRILVVGERVKIGPIQTEVVRRILVNNQIIAA